MRTTNWYLAELVKRTDFLRDPAIVYVDLVLIKAESDEAAYEKAMIAGRSREVEYTNTDYEKVVIRFLGLRNLHHIYEELEDGSELIFEEYDDLTEEEIASLVKAKSDLSIFKATIVTGKSE